MTDHALYHISDRPGIELFEPRPCTNGLTDKHVVWAIDEEHLPNYLLPRDCPRVTFFAREDSTADDVARFMCGTVARRVIAVESGWYSRITSVRLCQYSFDPASFTLLDETAGYYVSEKPVRPVSERAIDDAVSELLKQDIELRVMKSLWELREAVIHSSLGFSIIRMRNAQPPERGYECYYPLAGSTKKE